MRIKNEENNCELYKRKRIAKTKLISSPEIVRITAHVVRS